MTDTVKLIVNISKHQYEICKQVLKDFRGRPVTECEFAIAVGTPLDSVKAEITKLQMEDCCDLVYRGEVFEILDNIGKESEVKPNE